MSQDKTIKKFTVDERWFDMIRQNTYIHTKWYAYTQK